MRWQGVALKAVSQAVSWARVLQSPKAGLRVLTYHTVGQRAYGDYLNLNSIALEQFKAHLDVLVNYRHFVLDTAEIPVDATEVAITFDDGYADNLHVVAPLLVAKKIPFTVFVTSSFVRYGVSGFLSEPELKELAAVPGATIGAHGDTHCDLTQCGDLQVVSELRGSKSYLEDVLGKSVTTMAYPYGAANLRVRNIAAECGYERAACSYFDINRPERDLLMLNRSVVLNGDSSRVLTQKLNGDWDWYRLRMSEPLRKT